MSSLLFPGFSATPNALGVSALSFSLSYSHFEAEHPVKDASPERAYGVEGLLVSPNSNHSPTYEKQVGGISREVLK
jgi:hypothetical protein